MRCSFEEFCWANGMSNAVATFIATNDLAQTRMVRDDIKRLYRQDISKYADRDKLAIKEIYDLVPSELNNPNKRFVLKRLNEHCKLRTRARICFGFLQCGGDGKGGAPPHLLRWSVREPVAPPPLGAFLPFRVRRETLELGHRLPCRLAALGAFGLQWGRVDWRGVGRSAPEEGTRVQERGRGIRAAKLG